MRVLQKAGGESWITPSGRIEAAGKQPAAPVTDGDGHRLAVYSFSTILRSKMLDEPVARRTTRFTECLHVGVEVASTQKHQALGFQST